MVRFSAGYFSGNGYNCFDMIDNELIAEFMEIPKLSDSKGIMWDYHRTGQAIYCLRSQDLHYDNSWNWLMPVVEKIDSLYHKAFPGNEEFIRRIFAKEELFDGPYMDVIALPLATPISEVYAAVIKFIKWYNENL